MKSVGRNVIRTKIDNETFTQARRPNGPVQVGGDHNHIVIKKALSLLMVTLLILTMVTGSGLSVFADSKSMAEDTFTDTIEHPNQAREYVYDPATGTSSWQDTPGTNSYSVAGVHQSEDSTSTYLTFGSALPLSTVYIDTNYFRNDNEGLWAGEFAWESSNLDKGFKCTATTGQAARPYFDPTASGASKLTTATAGAQGNYFGGPLYSYTFKGAATLPDGTPANVKIIYSNMRIYVDKTYPNVDRDGFGQSVQLPYHNSIAFHTSGSYRVGGIVDARIQIVDDNGKPVDGTFIYAMNGINVYRGNQSQGRQIYEAENNNWFSEGIRVNSGNLSDLYIRSKDATESGDSYAGFWPKVSIETAGVYEGAVRFDSVMHYLDNENKQGNNNSYQTGFVTTANAASGISLTGQVAHANTWLAKGAIMWHRIRSVSGAGGTIQTTSEGNKGGTLDDKSDDGENAAVLGQGTYVVPDGKKVTYTMTPMPGYALEKLYVNDDLTVFPTEITGVADMADGASMTTTLTDGSVCTIKKSNDGKGVYTFDFPYNKSNHTILVTWKPAQAEAKATKIWYDKNDQFGKREDVTVHLVASVSGSDGSSSVYPIDYLPAYKISEQSVADGNEAGNFTFGSGNGYTGKNGERVYPANFSGMPQDAGGKTLYYFYDYATHKFTGYTYNTTSGVYEVDATDQDGDGNGKTDYWVDFLPKYDANGNQIIYTVEEDVPDGYSLTTITKDYGSLATYPGLTTAKFDYRLNNTLEPAGTVKVKATKALYGRPYNSTDEFVFVLSGKDGAPMPVGPAAVVPADGEDTATDVVKTVTPTANTVLTEVDFGIISYRKSDLTATEVTYSTANDEQKAAIRYWTVKNAPTEVEKRDNRGYAEYSDASGTYYYDEANQKLYDNNGNEIPGFDIDNYTKQTDTITADRVYDMLDAEDAADFNALDATLQASATATAYEGKFEYVVTENPKHPNYVENDTNTYKMTVRVLYNEKENKLYIDDEDVTTNANGVTDITAETTAALGAPTYTLHRDFFTNTYDNKVSWDPEITKTLNGRPIKADQFKDYFTIKAKDTDETVNAQVKDKVTAAETPMPGDANATTGVYPHGGSATSTTQEIESASSAPKGTNDVKAIVGFDTITYTNDDLLKEIYYDSAKVDQKNRVIKWVNGSNVYGPIPGSATATVTLADGSTDTVAYDNATDAQRAEVAAAGTGWTGTDGTYFDITQATAADLAGSKGYYYLDSRKFTYKIWESGTAKAGYTNDTAHDSEAEAYEVEVTVARDNTTGKLSVTQNKRATDLAFENKYEAKTEVALTGSKILDGRDLKKDEFSFTISAVTAGAPMPTNATAQNAAAVEGAKGTIDFGKITFTQNDLKASKTADPGAYDAVRTEDGFYEKTFVYEIRETAPAADGSGIKRDTSTKTIAITVREDDKGNFKVVAVNGTTAGDADKGISFTDISVNFGAFTNEYEASGSDTVDATKTLKGGKLNAGDFHFQLLDNKGTVLGTVSNDANGKISFPIAYNLSQVKQDQTDTICTYDSTEKTWTYTYTMKELKTDNRGTDNITYDATGTGAGYTLTVVVEDKEDGTLAITPSTDTTQIAFTNTYSDLEIKEEIFLKKILVGRKLGAEEFEFVLAGDDTSASGNQGQQTVENTAGGALDADKKSASEAFAFKTMIPFTLKDLCDHDGSYIDHDDDGTYSREFTYKVFEKPGTITGVTYDGTIHELKATLKYVPATETVAAHLEVTWKLDGSSIDFKKATPDTIDFTNTYDPNAVTSSVTEGGNGTTGTVDITKLLSVPAGQSRELKADEFVFEMLDKDNKRVALGTNKVGTAVTGDNDQTASVVFAPITFTKSMATSWTDATDDGTGTVTGTADAKYKYAELTYTIKEIAGNNTDDLIYDTASKTVKAILIDTGSGKLQVKWALLEGQNATFTNTVPSDTVDIPVRVTWVNDTEIDDTVGIGRPTEVTVTLQKQIDSNDDGTPDTWVDVTDPTDNTKSWSITLKQSDSQNGDPDNWFNDTFKNLPKYDDSGNEINYRVIQTGYKLADDTTESGTKTDGATLAVVLPGYEALSFSTPISGTLRTLVNTYEATVIAGTKTWVDPNPEAHNNSSEVKLTVYRKAPKDPDTAWVKLTEGTDYHVDWNDVGTEKDKQFVIKGLTKYVNADAADKVEYQYKVKEDAVTGYTTTYANSGSYVDVINALYNGGTITNVIEQDYVELTVTKTWVGDAVDDAVINLISDTVTENDGVVATHTFSKDSFADTKTLTYKFTNTGTDNSGSDKLPKYNLDPASPNYGKEIIYTVDEVVPAVAQFTKSVDNETLTVTNSNGQPMTVYAKKVWSGDENDTSKRQEVKFQLTQTVDGAVKNYGDPVSATEPETPYGALDEPVKWENLPTFVDGKSATYDVVEVSVPDGYTMTKSGAGTESSPYTITNTLDKNETSITVYKVWDDNNDQVGKRPDNDEVTVKLTAKSEAGTEWDGKDSDGNDASTITLNKDNNCTARVEKLPKTDATGSPYVYKVEESEVSPYTTTYKSTVAGTPKTDGTVAHNGTVTIINTYIEDTIEITATKTWEGDYDDEYGLRTDVILHLYGLNSDGLVVFDAGTKKIALDDESAKATWTNLPKHHYSDDELEWKIVEDPIFGYTSSVTGDAESGFEVTNTYVGPVSEITVTKEWQDDNDRDGSRPNSVKYTLWKKVGTSIPVEVETVTAVEKPDAESKREFPGQEDDFGYTWKNLAVTEEVTDENAEPVTTERVEYQDVEEQATNDDTEYPTEVQAVLYYVTEVYEDTVLSEIDTATNKPKYTEPVVEAVGPGEFNVINARTDYETVNVIITKTWADKNNADGLRPNHIKVLLLADGKPMLTEIITSDSASSPDEFGYVNTWEYEFDNLPKKNSDGIPIAYSVKEIDVAGGYSQKISELNPETNGILIVNSRNYNMKSIAVTKVWQDGDGNTLSEAPEAATFHLMKIVKGEVTAMEGEEYTVTIPKGAKGEQLKIVWGGLDILDEDGYPIEYNVTEEAVDGYSTSYGIATTQNNVTTLTITNKANKETIVEVPVEIEVPVIESPKPVVTYIDPLADGSAMNLYSDYFTSADAAKAEADPGVGKDSERKHAPDMTGKHSEDGYTFTGWSATQDKAGNWIVVAKYNVEKQDTPVPTQTVTYVDGVTGKIIKSDAYTGTPITAPEPPTHSDYTWSRWEENEDAAGNKIYTAVYNPECRNTPVPPTPSVPTHWVTYVDPDGTVYLAKTTISTGQAEPAVPADPTKDGYIFGGWVRTTDAEGNVTYTAKWLENAKPDDPTPVNPDPEKPDDPTPPAPETHWVQYVDENGNIIYMPKVVVNGDEDEPAPPADPTRDGYVFDGWDRQVDDNGNVTYTATWKPESKTEPTPTKPEKPAENVPKTGDASDVVLWILLLAGSTAAAVLTRRRQNSK